MKCFKITYQQTTKRVSEVIESLDQLTKLIPAVFSCIPGDSIQNFTINYLGSQNIRRPIRTNEEFTTMISECQSNNVVAIRLELIESKDKDLDKEEKNDKKPNVEPKQEEPQKEQEKKEEPLKNEQEQKQEIKQQQNQNQDKDKDKDKDQNQNLNDNIKISMPLQPSNPIIDLNANKNALNEFNLLEDNPIAIKEEDLFPLKENIINLDNNPKQQIHHNQQQQQQQQQQQPQNFCARIPQITNQNNKDQINEDKLILQFNTILTHHLSKLENKFEQMIQSQTQSLKSGISQPHPQPQSSQQQQQDMSKISITNIGNNQGINSINNNKGGIQSMSINDNSRHYTNEICSHCGTPTYSKKYVCIVCDQIILCELCKDEHIIHPLIRIVLSKSNQALTTRNDIIKYLQTKKVCKKRNHQTAIQYFFNRQMKFDFILKLQTKDGLTSFAIPKDRVTSIKVVLSSLAVMSINEDIYFIVINSHFMKVTQPEPIKGIKAFGSVEVEIELDPQNQILTETIEIGVQVKEANIVFEPLILEIKVLNPIDVELENAKLFFKDYEQIAKISDEDKVVMYRLFSIEGKDNVTEINKILSKYNIQIPLP